MLSVPAGVDVRKVDLSIELQILAFHAQRRSAARPESRPEPVRGRTADRRGGNAKPVDGRSTPQVTPDRGQGLGGGQVSVLVVGLSHKSAPVATLERAAADR